MAATSLFNQGLTLMLFGMGFVFVFLTLLVLITSLMSRLITQYEKTVGVIPAEGIPSPSTYIPKYGPLKQHAPATTKTNETTIIAIISAAVHKFRART